MKRLIRGRSSDLEQQVSVLEKKVFILDHCNKKLFDVATKRKYDCKEERDKRFDAEFSRDLWRTLAIMFALLRLHRGS